MVINLDIIESPLRPNRRPPPLPNKRGTITFIAEIDEPRGRSVTRNLTRGVNETDDPYNPPFTDTPVTVSPLTLGLEAYRISIEAGGGGLLPLSLEAQAPFFDFALSLENAILELKDHVLTYQVGGDNILPADVNFDFGDLRTSTGITFNELLLDLGVLSSGDDFGPGEDTAAIGNFSFGVSFALPANMVTTPDDPSPL